MITYCKCRKTNEWAVVGPEREVQVGKVVTVERKDGSTRQETITEVGPVFEEDNQFVRYGYIDNRRTGFPLLSRSNELTR